jgi:Protein of unknown function (DUF4233)
VRSPTRIAAATTLTVEALVVVFAGLVAKDLSSLGLGAALGISGALAVACLVGAGLVGRPGGYVVGSVLQVLVIGFGFWVHAMFVVGAIFTGLWVLGLVMGTRAEAEARRRWGPVTGTRPDSPSDSGPTPG